MQKVPVDKHFNTSVLVKKVIQTDIWTQTHGYSTMRMNHCMWSIYHNTNEKLHTYLSSGDSLPWRRNWTTSSCPWIQAMCKTLLLSSSTLVSSAPPSSSSLRHLYIYKVQMLNVIIWVWENQSYHPYHLSSLFLLVTLPMQTNGIELCQPRDVVLKWLRMWCWNQTCNYFHYRYAARSNPFTLFIKSLICLLALLECAWFSQPQAKTI